MRLGESDVRKFRGHDGNLYLLQINRLKGRLELKKHQQSLVNNANKRGWRIRYNERFIFRGLDVLYFSVDQGTNRFVSYVISSSLGSYVLTFAVEGRLADERLFGRIFKSIQLQ